MTNTKKRMGHGHGGSRTAQFCHRGEKSVVSGKRKGVKRVENPKTPTGGRIVVEKADGEPKLHVEWTYEETPPTVERQREKERG